MSDAAAETISAKMWGEMGPMSDGTGNCLAEPEDAHGALGGRCSGIKRCEVVFAGAGADCVDVGRIPL